MKFKVVKVFLNETDIELLRRVRNYFPKSKKSTDSRILRECLFTTLVLWDSRVERYGKK